MRLAYFDLLGGAAGDMILAALLDAGADFDALSRGLAPLCDLLEHPTLSLSRVARVYLDAAKLDIHPPPTQPDHRHLPDILSLLQRAQLPPRALQRATDTFWALARAEARAHGTDPEHVHFHEVGAVDAILDIAGTCLALDLLDVETIITSPIPLGRGQTTAAHGLLPIPAPATLRLLAEVHAPIEGRDTPAELVTPTGAALLATLSSSFGHLPSMTLTATGYGAGSRQLPDSLPNVVRVLLGTPHHTPTTDQVVLLETQLDDQPPEHTAFLTELLLQRGALDVFITPILMKKGRPGHLVTTLAPPSLADTLQTTLLSHSSTLGVRRLTQRRATLPRRLITVDTPWGPVPVKLAQRPDGRASAAPEYEDCAQLARQHDLPLARVFDAALRAAHDHPSVETTPSQ